MTERSQREVELAEEEGRLVFGRFDETTAFEIGCALVARARAEGAPVVIDIRTPDRTLFHAALPGASPSNDLWARRKSNTVFHFHRCSLSVGLENARKNRAFGPEIGIDPRDFADHGGSFPVRVTGAGVVAAITVSGLASADDHAMITAVLEAHLAG